MNHFKNTLREKQEFIEKILKENTYNEGNPKEIFESFNYSLFVGGKRIRPILLLEACRCVGGDVNEAIPLACGIEMMHTYSLVHDDLPCMDDDELRRGKPTNHTIYGYATALLAGDALLNLCYEVMIKGALKAKDITAYTIAMEKIAVSGGVKGMIAGQVADMNSEGTEANKEILDFIHTHKTGAILNSSIIAGAIVGGAKGEQLKALEDYAASIGLMFQVVDDILDVVGDEKKLGKKVGMDSEHNKMTYPYVYGLDKSYEKVDQLYKEAVDSLSIFGKEADFLRETANYLHKRNH